MVVFHSYFLYLLAHPVRPPFIPILFHFILFSCIFLCCFHSFSECILNIVVQLGSRWMLHFWWKCIGIKFYAVGSRIAIGENKAHKLYTNWHKHTHTWIHIRMEMGMAKWWKSGLFCIPWTKCTKTYTNVHTHKVIRSIQPYCMKASILKCRPLLNSALIVFNAIKFEIDAQRRVCVCARARVRKSKSSSKCFCCSKWIWAI